MNCEICGVRIQGRPLQISIERSLLVVCQDCSRFGLVVDRKTALNIEKTIPKPGPRTFKPKQTKKEHFDDFILVENFGEAIKKAREKMGITREVLAKKLGEKDSVIRRIESGEMYPSSNLTGKIEHLLKMSLKAKADTKVEGSKPTYNTLTLGDVAILKEGKTN
jgi:putative transcription factor